MTTGSTLDQTLTARTLAITLSPYAPGLVLGAMVNPATN
jgi:hypothetical protein